MKAVALLCLLAVLVAPAQGVHASRPRVDHTHSLIQEDGAASTSTTDEAVVTNRFGSTTVNMESLKSFLTERHVSDLGTINDLITRSACVIRLEDNIGTSSVLTTAQLQDYLVSRLRSTSGSKDELLDRACDYQSKELVVVAALGESISDITPERLKAELASLGFISTGGTKPELVLRLGKSLKSIETVKTVLGDPNFDTSTTKELLSARGLSTEGTMDVLLTRLADYLVNMSENTVMPGISTHCDVVTESAICIDGGAKILGSDAIPSGLIGKWTFDDAHMLDHSGHAHHAKEAVFFGPGLNGVGYSAKFDGSAFLELPHSDKLSSTDFCVTFFMYLLSDSNGYWRTVIHKGSRDNERTPTFFLEPQTRGLEFFVSTTDDSQPAGERVWSNTFVPLRKWTHVAGCVEGRNLRLYINGILDAENTTIGIPLHNSGPMYVGHDPWRPTEGIVGYVDELRYYDKSLSMDYIQAEASAALGGVESSFVELGCMGCSLDQCPKTCRHGFRMCTQRDLHSGGYFVSRSMGWASADTQIWKAEDGVTPPSDKVSGLCMCCRIGEQS